MSYIDGFVAAVPQENERAYLDHARAALSLFKDHGATRMVENWGDDVPEGKVTDFHRSVRKKVRRCCSAGSNGRRRRSETPA
jgi:uncharacterized protein YbaA (DUF1428 family)